MEHKKELLAIVKNFRLFDDTFFAKVFENNIPGTQFLLRAWLYNPDIEITKVWVQKRIVSLTSRSVCLDLMAEDKDGNWYNVEIQRDPKGISPERARYLHGMMDTETLRPGDAFVKLRTNTVIFLSETDIMKQKNPIFTDAWTGNRESGKKWDMRQKTVIINGAWRGNDPIGKLNEDFAQPDPNLYHFDILKRYASFYKGRRGKTVMCEAVEKYAEKYAKEYYVKQTRQLAFDALKSGRYPDSTIMDLYHLNQKELDDIKKDCNLA